MAKRIAHVPEKKPDDRPNFADVCTPVAMWENGEYVCVEIIDTPVVPARDGVCHCEACSSAFNADWAERFLP